MKEKRRKGPHTVSTLWTRVHEKDDKQRAEQSNRNKVEQTVSAHRLQKCPCTKFIHLI